MSLKKYGNMENQLRATGRSSRRGYAAAGVGILYERKYEGLSMKNNVRTSLSTIAPEAQKILDLSLHKHAVLHVFDP